MGLISRAACRLTRIISLRKAARLGSGICSSTSRERDNVERAIGEWQVRVPVPCI